MKKRVLSLILALVLCVGVLPASASAATETENAREIVANMPDNPGVPVFYDVTKNGFWPDKTYWKYPVSIEEVYSQIEELTYELIKGKSSDEEKAKAIFDWVAQNISYDYEAYAKKKWSREAETAFYVFYRKSGICNGYTKLVNLMGMIAGVPTAYILGKEGTLLHAWNAVYADGRWIYFDATWNEWDVDPYYYHDSIKNIQVYGEAYYQVHEDRVVLLPQSGYVFPENLVIPSFVTQVCGGNWTEEDRMKLKSVVVHKNVERVDDVFYSCPNLKSITFEGGPDSKLTYFYGLSRCPSVTEIVIPDGVTKIEKFWECTSLRSVTLPDSIKEMEYSVFAGCTSLQDIRLSNGLEKIPSGAFSRCTSLKSLTIPSSVTKIGDMAFSNCPALESIYIPSSVTEIEKSVFIGVTPFYESPNVVIYTEPGSFIETYAKEHNIKVVTSGTPTPTPAPADSSTPSAWAQAEVTEATQAGLVPSDLLSSYTSAITREEFCRLMVKLIEAESGKDIADYVSSQGKEISAPFTDTSAQEVKAAYALGIVNGVSATKFNPTGSIARQEAAAMLERTAKLLGLSSGSGVSFSDSGSIASWASGSVAFVSGLTDPTTGGAVMGGMGNGSFGPTGTYTREQAIATTLRLFHCAA